jgi:DNA polymerase-1
LVLDWREANKIASTYTESILDKLDGQGVLHTSFQQVGTNTGRLSCRDPNLQNIAGDSDARAIVATGKPLEEGGEDPWSVRRAFYVPEGEVGIYVDYSQIELRVLADYSQDPILLDAYRTGQDIHTRTATEVYGSGEKKYRKRAKVANFGLSYGLSAKGFARQLKVSLEEAEHFYRVFEERYAGIPKLRRAVIDTARLYGGLIMNKWGRHRRVRDILSDDGFERGKAERRLIGSLIQGTAAELTKESIVRIARELKRRGLRTRLRLTIHDDIQAMGPREEFAEVVMIMKAEMERYPEFSVPIVADVEYSVTHWAAKQEVKGL